MILTLFHLTDIHFSTIYENTLIKKQNKLFSALIAKGRGSDHIVFCISGDIANFGIDNEYSNIALPFFDSLKNIFEEELNDIPCEFLFIPGNHDCDFSDNEEMDLRDQLINSIISKPALCNNSKFIKGIRTQEHFLSFKDLFHNEWTSCKLIGSNDLFDKVELNIKGKSIIFNLFNTSWISTKKERPGNMFYPVSFVEDLISSYSGDINVSLLHHPTHWLNPNNKRDMENLLQKHSDFILSGHEHSFTNVTLTDWTTRAINFIEGSALQEHGSPEVSGFNSIQIDLESLEFCCKKHTWDSTLYKEEDATIWKPFTKELSAKFNEPTLLNIKPEFEEFLYDIGIPISHPRVPNLKLKDIYIYPNIEEVLYQKDVELLSTPEEIPELLKSDKESHFLFKGDKDSGKTALAKILFNYFVGEKYFPLFISGGDVTPSLTRNIDLLIKKTIDRVYGIEKRDSYIQLKKEQRILIVDDWHRTPINSASKASFLEHANRYFNQVIFFSELNNSINDAIEMISKEEKYTLRYFDIMKFGHVKRDEFIENWVSLGQRETLEDSDLLKEVDRINRIMKPILMQSYVPKFPLYLLIIIKTIETGTPHNLDKSSNGYYFEILIKDSLAAIEIENNETDKIYQYLTDLAFEMLKHPMNSLTSEEWRIFHKNHLQYYDMNDDQIVFKEIQEKLVKEKVIRNSTKGYEFYYPYIYYFFVAQNLARNINKGSIKGIIKEMCQNLHNNEYANIIMFLTHLSKDSFIKEEVLLAAESIFNDVAPLKLEEDVNLINELCEELSPLILHDVNVKEHRKMLNKQMDENERNQRPNEAMQALEQLAASTEDESSEVINAMQKIEQLNKGFKMLDIIGQILKNYYGSMSGSDKQELCEEHFKLGLRINHRFISDLNNENESLLHYISSYIIDKGLEKDVQKAQKTAKNILYSIGGFVTFNTISKIALSIGTEDLDRTYHRVREQLSYNSIDLIHLFIMLECYEEFPSAELQRIYECNKYNKVALQIIQNMIKRYLYMFETSKSQKQRICSLIGIEISPKMKVQLLSK
ncbi:metallophosphoesterase [Fictibacillus barbaricus]|uniref:Metallophosphoesterase n=1 Tax=Fictibacillus barbaricus TaxID=182136 RepID=A0ABS2ZBG0_9BACL|nr:metallophosphoesterase [Fictibacillus barbaricus]MBN3545086.1 metallophosphoesterase [Fictibacillus barbaricus]GGB61850.1 hypothetical protein GCM10007199_29640 [Fictibacillus barbaricus]